MHNYGEGNRTQFFFKFCRITQDAFYDVVQKVTISPSASYLSFGVIKQELGLII